MIDLGRRATDQELLDEGVSDAEALESLADLQWVNRWLSNTRQLIDAVCPYLERSPRPRLLDVGCGSADVLAFLQRRVHSPVEAVGVDLKLLHLQAAPQEVHRVVADVRALPFPAGSFDVVMASQFLHHFDDHEVVEVLRRLHALARRALVVNDLHRARLPYLFGRAAFPWILRSRVSRIDGVLSIRRAFTPSELATAFAAAGIPVRIRRSFPYRLLAVAEKEA